MREGVQALAGGASSRLWSRGLWEWVRASVGGVGSGVGPGIRDLGCRRRIRARTEGWGAGRGAGSGREFRCGRGLGCGLQPSGAHLRQLLEVAACPAPRQRGQGSWPAARTCRHHPHSSHWPWFLANGTCGADARGGGSALCLGAGYAGHLQEPAFVPLCRRLDF